MNQKCGRRRFLRKAAVVAGATGTIGIGATGTASADTTATKLVIEERSGNRQLRYRVNTTGDIRKRGRADPGDDDNGSQASGIVENGGVDSWEFIGEVVSIMAEQNGYATFDFQGGFEDSNRNKIEAKGDGRYTFNIDGKLKRREGYEPNDNWNPDDGRAQGYVYNGGTDYYYLKKASTERFVRAFLNPGDSYIVLNKT